MPTPAERAKHLSKRAAFRVQRVIAGRVLRLPGPLVSRLGRRWRKTIDGRTLDAQLAALIELDRLRGTVDFTKFSVPTARRKFAAGMALLDLPHDPSVEVHPVTVAGAAEPLEARLYVPASLRAPSPLVVFFHGGGMCWGDLDTYDAICRFIARHIPARLIAVEYRLAPEHPYPAAPEDALAAFLDIARRAAELGADPARLAVMGDSAGGTLSATVAQRTMTGSVRPFLQVLLYPGMDLKSRSGSHRTFAEGYFLTQKMAESFMDHYFANGGDRQSPEASPGYWADLGGIAPALVYTAGFDILRDEGNAYAERLRSAGRLRHHKEFGTLVHGFAQMAGAIDAAREALQEICRDTAEALSRPE